MSRSTLLLPNYNNEVVLPFMFETLRRNVDCSSVNIVVADDGSEDDGIRVLKTEIAKSKFAKSEILELNHEGVVSALNAGLQAVKTEYVLRIDGDATVETAGWTAIMERWLDGYPSLGLVGGQVIFDSGRIHSFGRSAISETGLFDIGCIPAEPIGHRIFDSHVIRPKSGFYGLAPYEVDTVLGVCVAFRTTDAAEIGGFDKSYNPVWIEDDDFGLSMRLVGKKNLIDPKIQVIHRISLRGSRQPGTNTAQGKTGITLPYGHLKDLRTRISRRAKIVTQAFTIGKVEDVPVEPQGFTKETSPWRMEILRRHYDVWRAKWCFDVVNPSLSDIYEKYWKTQICWKCNPEFYAESKAINWVI